MKPAGSAAVSWRDAWPGLLVEPDAEQALATVHEMFPDAREVGAEELEYLSQERLIEHWNDEVAKVAGGFVNVLHGWDWLEHRKACTICGSDCIARDPSGHIRHPSCESAS